MRGDFVLIRFCNIMRLRVREKGQGVAGRLSWNFVVKRGEGGEELAHILIDVR